MKKLLGLFLIMMLFVSGTVFTTSKPDAMHTMEGTWELQSFYNYDGENIIDTVPLAEGYRQVKMYYNGKVMWSRTTSSDTKDADGNDVIGRFGYGSYRITENELIETIEYGDKGMMRDLEALRLFTFELVLTDSTYSQISFDEEGNRTFSENYLRID
ncbi:hypothetical protein [Muriicola sp. Z0-33]|uniref:hypothetical protein n=1 Tax=Muriicola sp. Z0-33 TaxID=2816957 RepID=UPI002238D99D|nr:hypothetical protein [Muriicola sp. Z0-33]MCW5516964.1 hypothetical protein [Muriicola sp. Z0-33]